MGGTIVEVYALAESQTGEFHINLALLDLRELALAIALSPTSTAAGAPTGLVVLTFKNGASVTALIDFRWLAEKWAAAK